MSFLRTTKLAALLFPIALLLFAPVARGADGAFREDFEGVEPTWRVLSTDTRYRIDDRKRTRQPAHTGAWSEALAITAADGTHIHYGRQIGSARIIDELSLSVWVLSDRPSLQWLARVVLPRSIDPQTSRPRTLFVYGPMYQATGQWEELKLVQLPREVERQARVVQSSTTTRIDVREAYVDAVMLNVFGGRGTTRVWIDDLAITGFVGSRVDPVEGAAMTSGTGSTPTGRLPNSMGNTPAGAGSLLSADGSSPQPGEPSKFPTQVSLRGAVLTVAGRPVFPRIIEHRGEALATLHQLGFNGVRLAAPPDGALLAEAAENGMWLIAPPPPLGPGARIGHEYDPVLAWHIGQRLSRQQFAATEALVRQLREADRGVRRPILCEAATEVRAYSELADILEMGQQPLGSSLELGDYINWLRQRSTLTRPGVPVWSTIQTDHDPLWQAQLTALSPGAAPRIGFNCRQMERLVYSSLAGGSRGLIFSSHSTLDAIDPATRYRAALLRLMNIELALIENWAASGRFVMPAASSDPAFTAAVLQTERARLLMPLRSARGDQYVVEEGNGGEATFVVPGVPESNEAFELSSAGLRPLPHRRVTGGMSVTLREIKPTNLIVLTQDPVVISNLTRAAAASCRGAAELTRQVATEELALAETVHRRLAPQSMSVPDAERLLNTARDLLRRSNEAIYAADYSQAVVHGRGALRPLGQLARQHWLRSAAQVGSPVSSPLATSFATRPLFANFVQGMRSASLGDNLLRGGEFDDLEPVRRAGWQHFQLPQRLVASSVELSHAGPHGGGYCLRLKNDVAVKGDVPTIIESSPLWITTPAIPVSAGQVMQVHGWIRVPRPLTASVDGLMIVDSLGGESLAERIGQTRGWQEFTLYRAAPAAGNMTVTFALSGLGEAYVDDVTIRAVKLPEWNVERAVMQWNAGIAQPR